MLAGWRLARAALTFAGDTEDNSALLLAGTHTQTDTQTTQTQTTVQTKNKQTRLSAFPRPHNVQRSGLLLPVEDAFIQELV